MKYKLKSQTLKIYRYKRGEQQCLDVIYKGKLVLFYFKKIIETSWSEKARKVGQFSKISKVNVYIE